MKKSSVILVIVLVLAAIWLYKAGKQMTEIASFDECVAFGNPVMESYPRQCRAEGKTFIEDIGNEIEKLDIIRVETPRPNTVVGRSFELKGEARGNWYFEASFPVEVRDAGGNTLLSTFIMTENEWMTTEFVSFAKMITLEKIPETKTGTLILHKDNPSGLPENDDELVIPIKFE